MQPGRQPPFDQRSKKSNLFSRYQTNFHSSKHGQSISLQQPDSPAKRHTQPKLISTRDKSNGSTKLAYPINYASTQSDPLTLLEVEGKLPMSLAMPNNKKANIVHMMFKVISDKRRTSKVMTDPSENEQSFILIKRTKPMQRQESKSRGNMTVIDRPRHNIIPSSHIERKLLNFQNPCREYIKLERQKARQKKLKMQMIASKEEFSQKNIQQQETTCAFPIVAQSNPLNNRPSERSRSPKKLLQPLRPQAVEQAIDRAIEQRRLLTSSLNNNRTASNEYLLKRKFVNKKDHFVFGMEQRTTCQNRIGLYRDFLWKVNYSNGLLVQPQPNEQYKIFIGRGNNKQLIKGLMRRRFWWVIVDKMSDDVNFVWTQLKLTDFYDKQEHTSQTKTLIKSQSSINCASLSQTACNSSSLETCTISPLKRLPTVEQSKADSHANIFSQEDLIDWNRHYEKHKDLQEKLDEKVYYKRTFLLRKKNATKIERPIELRVQNHFNFNQYIGNKKAMFYCMRKFYEISNKNVFEYLPMTFHISKGTEDPEYKKFIKFYDKIREQRRINKLKNVWIVKPGEFTNRGHGITVCDSLEDIIIRLKGKERNANGQLRTFIVQKYLQRPFLYFKRKFDIRHYMMIACINGNFKGYWYVEGYIRTTSAEYDIKNCKDNYIHLTNDAVQKHSEEYGKYEKGNKISYADFQKYLDTYHKNKRYRFLDDTLNRMKSVAADAIKASFHLMDPAKKTHNFQIFGMDFMIDEDFHPWLIQINTNPCLELACPLLSRVIPSMLENAFKLTIDPLFQPPYEWPGSKKYQLGQNPLQNNRFSLIFDEATEGKQIREMYQNVQLIDKNMGDVEEEDAEYEDQGKQWNEEVPA